MTQILIVDQKAMAMAALAQFSKAIAEISVLIEPPKRDFNRKQMRKYQAAMRPFQEKLQRLQREQARIQRQIDELLVSAA